MRALSLSWITPKNLRIFGGILVLDKITLLLDNFNTIIHRIMLQEFIKDNLPPWIYTVYEKIQAALPNPIKPWFTVIIVLIVISFLIYGFRKRIKIGHY